MLGKLMKYELQASAKTFLPLYGVLLLFALVNRLLFNFSFGALQGIAITIYFGLMVAIAVLTIIVNIQRFYKTLLTEEGYLMFTLPVKTWQLVISRLFTAMIWVIGSGIVVMSSILIINARPEMYQSFFSIWREVVQQASMQGVNLYLLGIEGVFLLFLNMTSNILLIYTAIAIGHLFQQKQVLASFGAYMGIIVVIQAIASMIVAILEPLNFGLYLKSLSIPTIAYGTGIVFIIAIVIWSFCLFALTTYILNKRLNLN
ncbi:MAG: hypothetical protein WCI30_03945 [Clostridia bacterium]